MNQKEQIIAWLNDAYAMETSIARVLEKQVNQTKDTPEIQSRLNRHLEETRQQAERVRVLVERHGGSVSVTKSILANVMGNLEGMGTNLFSDQKVKSLLMDFGTEHFEIACYTSLLAAAEQLGLDDVVQVARQNLEEEEQMAEWLIAQIPVVTLRELQVEPVLG